LTGRELPAVPGFFLPQGGWEVVKRVIPISLPADSDEWRLAVGDWLLQSKPAGKKAD
jgi:hypothetical protein